MCGIAGIRTYARHIEVDPILKRMTGSLAHRGPDAEGLYRNHPIGMGHRRLSIIDLSDAANQPFVDQSGRYVLVFNGEIYNYRELRAHLTDHKFLTLSDTEVLMAAYLRWGPDCVYYLKGFFAFAIWDNQEETLMLCRDRLGIKPLYYYKNDDVLIFASEIRAFLESGLVERRLEPAALIDYFSYQSFSAPETPIKGIHQIRAGSVNIFGRGGTNSKLYWVAGAYPVKPVGTSAAAVQADIRDLFRKAVRRRLVSDVPIGAFLSGGIDSSAVVAMMADLSSKPPVTFNLSFEEASFDESAYARIIAEKYKTEHHEIRLSQQLLLTDLDKALSSLDIPSADGVNTFIVSRAIRQAGITVALSGVGGDELFAGYPFFKTIPALLNQPLLQHSSIRSGIAAVLGMLPHRNSKRLADMLRSAEFDVRALYPHFRRISRSAEIRSLTRLPEFPTRIERELKELEKLFTGLPMLSQISCCEYLGYTQHTLLKDTDQMSMAVGLEIREPFFDHELIDYVLNVPDALKKPVYPKSLLVESLKPLLPDEIVFRKKHGFLFPWQLWMRKELSDFCDRHIRRIAEREFMRGPALLKHWKRFKEGDPSVNWTQLWTFVVLEHWMEKHGVE